MPEGEHPSSARTKNTFRKFERLKSKKGFEFLFSKGLRVREGCISITYTLEYPEKYLTSPVMAGFSATKRRFKRAPDRNLLKRRMREAFRLHKSHLYDFLEPRGHSLVFLINYIYRDIQPYAKIERDYLKAVEKLLKRI